jgi:hypothetical protein
MRRVVLIAALVTAFTALTAVPALAAEGPLKTFGQPVTLGFYRGQVVSYFDFGPVKLAKGNKLAPIWAFANGAAGQRNIIDTVPGRGDYTPLWSVRLVTWNDDVTPRVLRSRVAVQKAVAAGEAVVKTMPIVVNCPVL